VSVLLTNSNLYFYDSSQVLNQLKINDSRSNIFSSSFDIIKLNKTFINKQKIEIFIEFLNKYILIYKLKLSRIKKIMNTMIANTVLAQNSIKLFFKTNMTRKTRKKKTKKDDREKYKFAYERVLIETVTRQHKKNEIKKMKKAQKKKKTFDIKKMITIEKKRIHMKEMTNAKKAKKSQNSKKTRKSLKIQASISQKTFQFCSFRAEIFDFSANICYFEEFDSFNAENSSSQFYIFMKKLCVRIDEVLKRF
jgi:hypothetical protein